MRKNKQNKTIKHIIVTASLCAGLLTVVTVNNAYSYAKNMDATALLSEEDTKDSVSVVGRVYDEAKPTVVTDHIATSIVEANDIQPDTATIQEEYIVPSVDVTLSVVSSVVEETLDVTQEEKQPVAEVKIAELVVEDNKIEEETQYETQPTIEIADPIAVVMTEDVYDEIQEDMDDAFVALDASYIIENDDVETMVAEDVTPMDDYSFDSEILNLDVEEIPVNDDVEIVDDEYLNDDDEIVETENNDYELTKDLELDVQITKQDSAENIEWQEIAVEEEIAPNEDYDVEIAQSQDNIEELNEKTEEVIFDDSEETEEEPVYETLPSNGVGSQIVEYAAAQVGVTPYVNWYDRIVDGQITNSLETGTDCSGFVSLIYGEAGIYAPTGSDAYQDMANTSYEDLQPGDVVVYRNGGHVAIYAGDDTIIHCSNEEEGTKISDMFYDEPTGYVRLFE